MKGKIHKLKIKIGELIYLKYINYLKYCFGAKKNEKFESLRHKKKVILTLTPNHGNLGDHAIAYASKKFIENKFPDYEFLELDLNEIYEQGKALKNVLTSDDIIMTLGGGNMGDLYKHEEWTRRFIIKTFKHNKIISLPQTICFSNTRNGKKELKKTRKIYNENNNLKLIAREKKSFELMKKHFGEDKVGFYPDMVLSLNEKRNINRAGVLLCLRSDEEGIFKNGFKQELVDKLKKSYKEVKLSDTVINERVNKISRDKKLDDIWGEMSKAEIVITDRLHGMIFCAITNTPCIVLKTYNHKVTGAYEWLRECENIKLVDSNNDKVLIENILNNISEINKKENTLEFKSIYNELRSFI